MVTIHSLDEEVCRVASSRLETLPSGIIRAALLTMGCAGCTSIPTVDYQGFTRVKIVSHVSSIGGADEMECVDLGPNGRSSRVIAVSCDDGECESLLIGSVLLGVSSQPQPATWIRVLDANGALLAEGASPVRVTAKGVGSVETMMSWTRVLCSVSEEAMFRRIVIVIDERLVDSLFHDRP